MKTKPPPKDESETSEFDAKTFLGLTAALGRSVESYRSSLSACASGCSELPPDRALDILERLGQLDELARHLHRSLARNGIPLFLLLAEAQKKAR